MVRTDIEAKEGKAKVAVTCWSLTLKHHSESEQPWGLSEKSLMWSNMTFKFLSVRILDLVKIQDYCHRDSIYNLIPEQVKA